eukprot:m.13331 g.13331  ORF g.13331 m.13331 type:complete len:268 (+) comp3030_c0_seq1:125-928(+)
MSTAAPAPDRGLNQFWYSPATLEAVVTHVVHVVTAATAATHAQQDDVVPHGTALDDGVSRTVSNRPIVALIGVPSVFYALPPAVAAHTVLLEFDRRFEVSAAARGHFVFFDYTQPLRLPVEMQGRCMLAVADPPFLSKDAMHAFCGAAAALLQPRGELVYATIPENETHLQSVVRLHGLGDMVRPLPFVPVQQGIDHRFRFFSTQCQADATSALECVNMIDAAAILAKEPESAAQYDDVDALFDMLKGAVISALVEDESEDDNEDKD